MASCKPDLFPSVIIFTIDALALYMPEHIPYALVYWTPDCWTIVFTYFLAPLLVFLSAGNVYYYVDGERIVVAQMERERTLRT